MSHRPRPLDDAAYPSTAPPAEPEKSGHFSVPVKRVQRSVAKSLRRPLTIKPLGQGNRLDLHGTEIALVEDYIDDFLAECRQEGYGFVIIVTGRGKHSSTGLCATRAKALRKLELLRGAGGIFSFTSINNNGAFTVFL